MIKPFRQFAVFGIHWFIILETDVSDKLSRNAKSLFNKPKRSFINTSNRLSCMDIVLTQSFAHIDTLVNTHKNNCIVKPV